MALPVAGRGPRHTSAQGAVVHRNTPYPGAGLRRDRRYRCQSAGGAGAPAWVFAGWTCARELVEIPRFRHDPDIARMAVDVLDRLRAQGRISDAFLRQAVQLAAAVGHPLGHQMDHAVRAALHPALDQEQARTHDLPAERSKEPRPDDDIRDAGLVAERDEDDAGVA